MFTTRNVVSGVIAITVLSVAWGCWTLTRPYDNGGLGADSYGTRRPGLRAIFDILIELDVPVQRSLDPPTDRFDRDSTLVLWKPNSSLITQEPRYLNAVGDWLNDGGRVVVALDDAPTPEPSLLSMVQSAGSIATLWPALRGPQIDVQRLDLSATDSPPENKPAPIRIGNRGTYTPPSENARRHRTASDDLKKVWDVVSGERHQQPTQPVPVRATGALERLATDVKTIEVPVGLQVLNVGTSEPAGRIECMDPWGQMRTLAALYRVGKGELIVVSSAAIGENRLIAQQDNSVLVVALVAPSGQSVILEEFYHGLTVRGNPLWLFTRRGFGLVSICLMSAVGLIIWRQAIFLGPPLQEAIQSRRSIGEYVTAMGLFLKRGKAARAFVLREARNGVLYSVRKELGLPPGRDQVEELAAVLKRRNPPRAERLIDAVQKIDQALAQPVVLRETEAIRLLQGISSCL